MIIFAVVRLRYILYNYQEGKRKAASLTPFDYFSPFTTFLREDLFKRSWQNLERFLACQQERLKQLRECFMYLL